MPVQEELTNTEEKLKAKAEDSLLLSKGKEFACVLDLPNGMDLEAWKLNNKDAFNTLDSYGYLYIYIYHINDIDEFGNIEKPHIQLVLFSKTSQRVQTILYLLIDTFCLRPSCVSVKKVNHTIKAVRYLTHIDYPEKTKHKMDELVSNMSNDSVAEYFVRDVELNVNFSLLWDYIVDKHYDDVEIMARIGLELFNRYDKCITKIRLSDYTREEKYKERINALVRGLPNENI